MQASFRAADPARPHTVLAEPSARDSMAAIGLAAAMLERRDPEAVMGSFAADHVITDPDGFRDSVREGRRRRPRRLAGDDRHRPDLPSATFGYIHLGEPLAGPGPGPAP